MYIKLKIIIKVMLISLFVSTLIEIAEFLEDGVYNYQVALNLLEIMCTITGIAGILVIHFVKNQQIK